MPRYVVYMIALSLDQLKKYFESREFFYLKPH
jgi:hypothetical protein